MSGSRDTETPVRVGRPPTDRQREIMRFMRAYFDREGTWPTQREVAEGCNINSTNATPYIEALIKKGLAVRVKPRGHRAVELSDLGMSVTEEMYQPRLL